MYAGFSTYAFLSHFLIHDGFFQVKWPAQSFTAFAIHTQIKRIMTLCVSFLRPYLLPANDLWKSVTRTSQKGAYQMICNQFHLVSRHQPIETQINPHMLHGIAHLLLRKNSIMGKGQKLAIVLRNRSFVLNTQWLSQVPKAHFYQNQRVHVNWGHLPPTINY